MKKHKQFTQIDTHTSSGGFISQVTLDTRAKESTSINSVNNITLALLSACIPSKKAWGPTRTSQPNAPTRLHSTQKHNSLSWTLFDFD